MIKNKNENRTFKNSFIPILLEEMEKITNQMRKCVCKIYIRDLIYKGTGFFCYIPIDNEKRIPVLITNYHVLDKSQIKREGNIIISIENDLLYKVINLDEERQLFTSEKADITIIEIIPKKDNIYDFLEIDSEIKNKEMFYHHKESKQFVYLLNYPNGEHIAVSIGKIESIRDNNDMIHSCFTKPGSSGSPILSLINFKVIGIHCASYNMEKKEFKIGKFIQFAIEEFNKEKYSIEDSMETFNSPIKNLKIEKKESYFKKNNRNSLSSENLKRHKNLLINKNEINNKDKSIEFPFKVKQTNINKLKIISNRHNEIKWYRIKNNEINKELIRASREKEKSPNITNNNNNIKIRRPLNLNNY